MNTLKLKQGFDKRIKYGHLWVFSNEVSELPKIPAGEVVEVFEKNSLVEN